MKNITQIEVKPNGRARLKDACWDDMTFPATRIRQGATAKPDFDTTDVCLLFPQNDADEIAYISEQMRHCWKYGTPIRPHVHWLQENATKPTWKIDYRFANNGEDFGDWTTGAEASTHVFTYTSGSIVQISAFPEIDMSDYAGSSTMFQFKLYRDDNDLTGDAKMLSFDFHYQIDWFGSGEEYEKGDY